MSASFQGALLFSKPNFMQVNDDLYFSFLKPEFFKAVTFLSMSLYREEIPQEKKIKRMARSVGEIISEETQEWQLQ